MAVTDTSDREQICDLLARFGHATDLGTVDEYMAVSIDGDTVTAQSYFIFLRTTGAQPQLGRTGVYHDALRRTPDGWRLAHRVVRFG